MGKNLTFGKKWIYRKNCKFRIFLKNLEILKQFGKNLEILKQFGKNLKILENFGNLENKIGNLRKEIGNLKKKPSKFGKICKLGKNQNFGK